MRRYKGRYVCSKDCEHCEGSARVVVGDGVSFNSNTMELSHCDETAPCPNAEWDEPEYDKYEGRY